MKSLALFFVSVLMLAGITKVCSQNPNPAERFENVFSASLRSEILNEDRVIYVSLPEDYVSKKYPVLYLLDGDVIERYDEALEACSTNPHIIIGIQTIRNRDKNLIPVKLESGRPSGGADAFLKFLIEELQPFVNSNYNSNGQRILYGGSNAGLFTIFAMLEKPNSFFAYISSCPTIGHCNEFMIDKAKRFTPKSKLKDKFLFIHYGLKDSNERVTEYIPAYNDVLVEEFDGTLNMDLVSLPDGGHVPYGSIVDGMRFIYGGK